MLELVINEFGVSLSAWAGSEYQAVDQALRSGDLPKARRQEYWQLGKLSGVGYFWELVESNVTAVKNWLAARSEPYKVLDDRTTEQRLIAQ